MKQLGDRNTELKKVLRYGTKGEWEPMFYRPDLLIHTKRVFWITREITKYLTTINPDIFSKEVADELAIFHDDTEIITGDIVSVEKEGFTSTQKAEYEQETLRAIHTLELAYGQLATNNYKDLLVMDQQKTSLEYLIVSYADKLDAHMEICHEIFAGNTLCVTPLSRWNLEILPFDYTRNKMIKILQKLSQEFGIELLNTHPLFSIDPFDFMLAHSHGSPYTIDTIHNNTGYTPYDSWKSFHFQYGNTTEKEYLYTQKEFT